MQGTEDQLVARCRAGDLDAFAQVYAQYERQVYRYAFHLLGHRDDADDVKQETFVKAFLAMPGFRSEASLQTWLLKICGNLCRDRIKSWDKRKVQYDARLEQDMLPGDAFAEDPMHVVARSQMTETVFLALQGMPAAQREIILLHEVEDLSYEEIANVLGCSRTSVKLRIFRARRCLKERVASLMKAKGMDDVGIY
jgi:RNA polymerase sigma-70 factor (ECF subfamily)